MITLTTRTFGQPTLSIYLGGSGIAVGEALLDLLPAIPAETRPLIEPFFIDSQEPTVVDHERARHYCYRDLNQFYEPTFQDFVAQRFPENLGMSPVMSSCEGCGVTRIFGAASLVARRDDFGDLVEQAVARLRRRRRESTQPLQVFITSSACGGTGAGMLLDAAALVRHVFRTRLGEKPRIFFFLIGPSVFFEDPSIPLRTDQEDRMRASAYALLKELHHFAQGHPFTSAYRLRDEQTQIGNDADDDRLFEWVYWVDGRGEHSGPTRSLAEVAWAIAEAQLHLAFSEVGRKVAESMPNQREERVREYAPHFVHPDNKQWLSAAVRSQLEVASRKTFLASLSVRNVRFPAEEIRDWLRWGWVREAVQQTLLRQQPGDGEEPIDEMDRVLGYRDGTITADGLLADLGLRRDQLLPRLAAGVGLEQELPALPGAASTPERVAAFAEQLLAAAARLVEAASSPAAAAAAQAGADRDPAAAHELVAASLASWSASWREGLAEGGDVAERLWRLAWDRAAGRGMQWLDSLLVRAAEVLTSQARAGERRPDLESLAEQLREAQEQHQRLHRTLSRERSTLAFRGRALLAGKGIGNPYSETLRRRSQSLLGRLQALNQDLQAFRSTTLGRELIPRAWLAAAAALNRWREEVLSPTIVGAENALTMAANRWALARQALSTQPVVAGRRQTMTTVQLADDDLLAALLRRRGAAVDVQDLVLEPLRSAAISRHEHRLDITCFRRLERDEVVAILHWHVSERTRPLLAFLDDGWQLDEVRQRLHGSVAKALDLGAEPLARFSRDALGLRVQGYLLVPPTVILPDPFGRELGRMSRLVSSDPRQLGVVSFVFGIPPNALEGIEQLFAQYTLHVGDQWRNRAHDRYPLHVFRGAAEAFDEPHSPLSLQLDAGFAESLLAAARELWGTNGGFPGLDIRSFDGTVEQLTADWNRLVELSEKVLRRLASSPVAAASLFRGGRHPRLRDLHDRRERRGPRATDETGEAEHGAERGDGAAHGKASNGHDGKPPAGEEVS